MATPKKGKNILTFAQCIKVRGFLDRNHEFISKQAWSRDRAAEEATKELGFPVTASNLPQITATIHGKEFPWSGRINKRPGREILARLERAEKCLEEVAKSSGLVSSEIGLVKQKIDVLEQARAELHKDTGVLANRLVRLEADIRSLASDLSKIMEELGIKKLDSAVSRIAAVAPGK